MADCSRCTSAHKNDPVYVPYIAHESMLAKMERIVKRLWVAIILLIVLLVGSNLAWLWYESQYVDEVTTTIETEQSSESGSNYAVGGDLIGNAES